MKVTVHQPNYFPWLGYFYKATLADTFIFLDDVQYTKGGYSNRVQILENGAGKWITVPVTHDSFDPISLVRPASPGWEQRHLSRIRNAYGRAPSFPETWEWIQGLLKGIGEVGNLAEINEALIKGTAEHLGIGCKFVSSSGYDVGDKVGSDRLLALMQQVAPGGTYLSGSGGANYQDEAKFEAARIGLEYVNFSHPIYDQGQTEFIGGLSILDALFCLGREKTAALLQ